LIAHYERLERPEAINNLAKALQSASDKIEQNPNIGHPFPRPYPQAAKFDFLWLKSGHYWIGL
jgi:plasmid stabilization system protein ParE